MHILASIGHTSLVELKKVVPQNGAKIFVKMESQNPTGSMKDRMARAVIEGAIKRGTLKPGGTVVEYTGGSTGTSLAFVCASMGIPIKIVTSDAFSREKRDHMRALGAELIEIPSDNGKTTKELIQKMISTAEELCRSPQMFFADQFNNPDAAAGYAAMAREIWEQLNGKVDTLVQSVGTAQCIKGVSSTLRDLNKDIRIVAVEPAESPVLSGGSPGPHKIEGVGPGFIPPIWKPELADEIITISTSAAKEMAKRLAKEEATFAGTSTGANVLATCQIAEQLGPEHHVVTIACDHGLKYLSTDLYSNK